VLTTFVELDLTRITDSN